MEEEILGLKDKVEKMFTAVKENVKWGGEHKMSINTGHNEKTKPMNYD